MCRVGIDGISFLPTLLGEPGQESHAYLYWEFHEKRGRVAIRKGFWKGCVMMFRWIHIPRWNFMICPEILVKSLMWLRMYPQVVAQLDKLLAQARTVSPIQRFNFPQRVKSLIRWEKAPEKK